MIKNIIRKKCPICNEIKSIPEIYNICSECQFKIKSHRDNLNKDLTIENLIEDNILLVRKNLRHCKKITSSDAKNLIENRLAKIYLPNIIYSIESKEKLTYENMKMMKLDKKTLWVKRIKEKVLERDNYICKYCGQYGDTVDHIIPKSKGGQFVLENLVCACEKCNKDKRSLDKKYFEKILKEKKEEKPQLSKLDSMLLQLKTKKQKWE